MLRCQVAVMVIYLWCSYRSHRIHDDMKNNAINIETCGSKNIEKLLSCIKRNETGSVLDSDDLPS